MTFVRHHMTDGQYYIFSSFRENRLWGRPELFEIQRRDDVRFVFGHWLSQEMAKVLLCPEMLLFTGLRPPRERILSEFRHHQALSRRFGTAPPEPRDFLATEGNTMCTQLVTNFPTAADLGGGGTLAEQAISVLSLFDHIYQTECLELSCRPILRHLGIEGDLDLRDNVSSSDDGGAEEAQRALGDLINESLAADLELWDRVTADAVTDTDGRRSLPTSDLSVPRHVFYPNLLEPDDCIEIVRHQLVAALIDEARLLDREAELRSFLAGRIASDTDVLCALDAAPDLPAPAQSTPARPAAAPSNRQS